RKSRQHLLVQATIGGARVTEGDKCMTQSSGSWRYWPALLAATTLASTLTGCGGGKNSIKDSKEQAEVTTAQVREIAKEAYIYGYPMVDNYRIQYAYFQDKQSGQYVSPWNT